MRNLPQTTLVLGGNQLGFTQPYILGLRRDCKLFAQVAPVISTQTGLVRKERDKLLILEELLPYKLNCFEWLPF